MAIGVPLLLMKLTPYSPLLPKSSWPLEKLCYLLLAFPVSWLAWQ